MEIVGTHVANASSDEQLNPSRTSAEAARFVAFVSRSVRHSVSGSGSVEWKPGAWTCVGLNLTRQGKTETGVEFIRRLRIKKLYLMYLDSGLYTKSTSADTSRTLKQQYRDGPTKSILTHRNQALVVFLRVDLGP